MITSLHISALFFAPVAAETFWVYANYNSSDCNGIPYGTHAYPTSADEVPCTQGTETACTVMGVNHTLNAKCSDDYVSTMRSMFDTTPYLIQENFNDSSCSIFFNAYGVPATGICEGTNDVTDNYPIVVSLDVNGQSSITYFTDTECTEEYVSQSVVASTLASHFCDANYRKWYSSADEVSESSTSSDSTASSGSGSGNGDTGLSTGAIIGIVCGGIVALLVVVGLVVLCRRESHGKRRSTLTTKTGDNNTSSIDAAFKGQPGLWNDDIITAKRIPRDKVTVKKLLSRGAFGEVYKGVFNRQEVAIKMLLSSTRGNIQNVNDFLAEAKLTATMDHPHIVTFIGVAWDSLSDMCVVLEFMDGGDLRTLLSSYEATKRPVGFDKQKATIALHVCHALTYLHSLMPPVIHRDLKSRNILLNRNLEAKLTDFGVSKERLDQTMTAGVGTSLWMAPEVMLGERYDVKADMFSFGVMLSELDVHTLPYAQAKERSLASTGRKMADATLLQKITAGEVQVEFSEYIPRSLLELGLACTSVDPLYRPTAAEALYRLQVILVKEYS
ncbi:putative serine/threonine-protein kinase [Phytophthora citrophthora]|uniref:Serine/threonine-protein kinase n=1 Tax=Phytophthora citrophthora TaxID=4793 RepID=A0AAD9GEM6_9STRA|nr:putative serine/threonine-protein kinase [Phytophthora citrophthora]